MPTSVPTNPKPCSICGDMFVPEKPSSRICPKDHYADCPVCGKPMVWNTTSKPKPCSKECTIEQRRRTCQKRYGVDHPMQSNDVQRKFEDSMVRKYSVSHALQNDAIKSKVMKTNLERYGKCWASASGAIRKKIDHTNLERYGSKCPLSDDNVLRKAIDTNMRNHGVRYLAELPEHRKRMREGMMSKHGVEFPAQNPNIMLKILSSRSTMRNIVRSDDKLIDAVSQASPMNKRISAIATEVADILSANGVDDVHMSMMVNDSLFTLVIPSMKTAFDVNTTESRDFIDQQHLSMDGSMRSHVTKTNFANAAGYRCIHVFDWDDRTKVAQLIIRRNRVWARDCEVYMLNPETARQFVHDYDLYGDFSDVLVSFGLVHDGTLVQVMTFGDGKGGYSSELLHLISKAGTQVVGGASKLFKFATDNFGIRSVISECDLAKFDGKVFERIGMNALETSAPRCVWSKERRCVMDSDLSRQSVRRKLRLKAKGKVDAQCELLDGGWLPVYDCGKRVYGFKK